jgi:flagellar hook protein FlgE
VAQVGTAGTGGLGTVTGGSIEASNVDVATEFGKMIVAQQAYQANARTITTMDQLVQTTMQMLSA